MTDELMTKSVESETLSNRLKYLLDCIGLSQSDAAVLLGISPKQVWRYLNGISIPTPRRLAPLLDQYEIDEEWLYGGVGGPPMVVRRKRSGAASLVQVLDQVSHLIEAAQDGRLNSEKAVRLAAGVIEGFLVTEGLRGGPLEKDEIGTT